MAPSGSSPGGSTQDLGTQGRVYVVLGHDQSPGVCRDNHLRGRLPEKEDEGVGYKALNPCCLYLCKYFYRALIQKAIKRIVILRMYKSNGAHL